MLPEIAAEALHFLSRRDLDKTCAVSKWLDAMIAQCCEVYPLRPVLEVALNKCENGFKLRVWVDNNGVSENDNSLGCMNEAVHFAGSILLHSYVERLELGGHESDRMTLSPAHWATLIDAIRSGAVERLQFVGADFSPLDEDALLVAVGCRGLQSLVVRRSDVPSGLVLDDLIRFCTAKGFLRLSFSENQSDAQHSLSDDAVLGFFFRADTAPRPHEDLVHLVLEGSGVTERFLTKFFERLRSSPVRPSGSLQLYGAAKQLGLSAFTQYLAEGGIPGKATCRFPTTTDDEKSYDVSLSEGTVSIDDVRTCSFTDMDFGPLCRSS